jgi:hypothetical protein
MDPACYPKIVLAYSHTISEQVTALLSTSSADPALTHSPALLEIAAQGMLSLPWLSLVLSLERDPSVRDTMHAHASAGSARLLVP